MTHIAYKPQKRYTIKNFIWVLRNLQPFRYDCPYCTPTRDKGKDPYSSSVAIRSMWDEKFHKYKFYARCKYEKCGYITPAYDTAGEAINHVDIDWALVEDRILIGE